RADSARQLTDQDDVILTGREPSTFDRSSELLDDRAHGVETVLRVLDHPGPRLGGGGPRTRERLRGPSAWSRTASKGCPLTRPRSMTASREHWTEGRPRRCASPPWLSRRSDASGGLTLDAAPLQADHPAHRATRAASDLIERTAHTQEVRGKLGDAGAARSAAVRDAARDTTEL